MTKAANTKLMMVGVVVASVLRAQMTAAQETRPQNSTIDGAEARAALEEVTVEARRPEWEARLSPGTVSILYPEQKKGEQKKLPDLLKEVPGVHIREINGAGQYTVASVRASTAAQVGVFVDGVLAKLGGDAATDLSMIPVENVVRIEVYRGYVPARFPGTWLGGVINIVTRKPEKLGGSASGGVSSYGGVQGSLSGTIPLGSGTFFLGANNDQSDGDFRYVNFYHQSVIEDVTHRMNVAMSEEIRASLAAELEKLQSYPVERTRRNNAFQNTDGLAKWQDEHWQLRAAWKRNFRLLPDYIGRDTNREYSDLETVPNGYTRNVALRGMEFTQWDFQVGRRQTLGSLDWGARVTWLSQDKHYEDPYGRWATAFSQWSEYQSKRAGAALDGTFKVGERHLFEFMANYSREELDVDGNAMDLRPDLKHYYEQTLGDVQLQDTITLNSAQDLWFTAGAQWNFSGGIGEAGESRLQWVHAIEDLKDSKVTWQVALKKRFLDSLTVRSTYGTYYRFPNLYELIGDGAFIVPMSPSVGPPAGAEHGKQWDFGISGEATWLGARIDGSFTYFGRDSENLLGLHRGSLVSWSYMNLGAGRAWGLELEGRVDWPRVGINFSATRMQTRVTNPITWTNSGATENTSRGEPFSDIPDWEGTVRLDLRVPGDRLSTFTEVRYVGEMYQRHSSGFWQTELTTVGLGAKLQVLSGITLTAGVKDLFDESSEQRLYDKTFADVGVRRQFLHNILYPLPGRIYYASAQWDF